ncbi:hypothetical protein [Cyclobacterium amurskyense]|uniref:Uncharacterized protein n=1 Tax=Cyclobacterium amurskyense TaxID=320787 RepID=A0A0H4PCY7_9BACT|nr:hypothetical protein [Cyclobacterium amurskyense]AKP52104.1 hypothetical protein CA2015_2694 [Cyclobacterium amurskyense]
MFQALASTYSDTSCTVSSTAFGFLNEQEYQINGLCIGLIKKGILTAEIQHTLEAIYENTCKKLYSTYYYRILFTA